MPDTPEEFVHEILTSCIRRTKQVESFVKLAQAQLSNARQITRLARKYVDDDEEDQPDDKKPKIICVDYEGNEVDLCDIEFAGKEPRRFLRRSLEEVYSPA